MQKMFAH